ncbi:hypothetical protein [Jeotgalibacillus sp. JSM ZJ347]|uniref:hypothetical protein n=1 Tax=Jeotgalibacillus sp. JSM ZJ347 TaxID=3342117 RepID=UPI0035A89E1B
MSWKLKGFILFVTLLIIGGSIFLINRMAVPDQFLTEEEILADLPMENPNKKVQDMIQIDEETYFVPYIADENVYGASVFKWLDGEWVYVSDSTSSRPHLLQAEGGPYVFWNVHPDDEVEKWEFTFLYNRTYAEHFRGSENERTLYMPHVQVNETLNTGSESYGYAKLPEKVKKTAEAVTTNPQSPPESLAFSMKYPIRWQALDSEGEVSRLEQTEKYSGGGRYNGDYVSMLNRVMEEELE